MGVKEEGASTSAAQLDAKNNYQRIQQSTDRDVKSPYPGGIDGPNPEYVYNVSSLILQKKDRK
jgi:hypothetical protein